MDGGGHTFVFVAGNSYNRRERVASCSSESLESKLKMGFIAVGKWMFCPKYTHEHGKVEWTKMPAWELSLCGGDSGDIGTGQTEHRLRIYQHDSGLRTSKFNRTD